MNSPYPSLFPYILIGLIIILNRDSATTCDQIKSNIRQNRTLNFMVGVYVSLLFVNTAWQALFGVINANEAISALVIYLLPTIYYWYFRSAASKREMVAVFWAMVVGGLMVGIYFAYDSYLKLALGEVSNYASAAFQYSLDRAGTTAGDANDARVNLGSRSFGLLGSHSVSGAWVVLGAIAALTLFSQRRQIFRKVVILVFGLLLLLGLNFTSMVAFSVIMFLFEFGGLAALQGQWSKLISNLIPLSIVVVIIAGVTFWIANDTMATYIVENLLFQKDLALGTGGGNSSMMGLMAATAIGYLKIVFKYPFALWIGDGFSTFGMEKGGDVGFIESLSRFGVPFFLVIVCGFWRLVKAALQQIKTKGRESSTITPKMDQCRFLEFAICITLLVFITELHYTVWADKSILPIVFFTLALYGRYLKAPLGRAVVPNNNEMIT